MQTTIDFPPAVVGEATVRTRNVMQQEKKIKQHRNNQAQSRKHPYDKCEQHTEQDYRLLTVTFCQDLDIDKELSDRTMTMAGRMLTLR